MDKNLDRRVVASFGREWRKFDQSRAAAHDLDDAFRDYFRVFPWERLPDKAVGFDLGCGTGRWARCVAPRVGELHCIDPSDALEVARAMLAGFPNCRFHRASVDAIPLPDESADFGYSLGVLHHVPDAERGLAACVQKLKPGAPFLLYLYYALENRPWWYRAVWQLTDLARRLVSRLPAMIKELIAELVAALVYWPLARFARWRERRGHNVDHMFLSIYRHKSFYVMRNDALDRFGTSLERRFTRAQIESMMRNAGLEAIRFSDSPPFWCAVGSRRLQRLS
jgi:SAM-dependent methyltransferase